MTDPTAVDDPPPPVASRQLTRSSTERLVAGVCGGLGEYTGIDPIVFRIGFFVAVWFGGVGLFAYLVAWLVLPDEHGRSALRTGVGGSAVSTATIAVIAVVILTVTPFSIARATTGDAVGILCLLLVVAVPIVAITRFRERRNGRREGTAPPSPLDRDIPDDGWVPPSRYRPAPSTVGRPDPVDLLPERIADPPRRRPSNRLRRITESAAVLVLGLLMAIDVLDVVDVRAVHYGVALLFVVAGGLVAGAWFGRGRPLILHAVVLSIFTLVAASVDGFSGGVGERLWLPGATGADTDYDLGIGHAVLDLDELATVEGVEHIDAHVGIGELEVDLPDAPAYAIEIVADSGIGQVDLPDGTQADRATQLIGASDDPDRLVLDLHVGVGRVEVVR